MKKIYFSLVLAVLVSVPLSAQEYNIITEEECVTIENPDGETVLNLAREGIDDRFSIQVAGIRLTMNRDGAADKDIRKKYKLAEPGHIGFLEVGINMLPTPDYSMYPAADGGFLDLNYGKSLQWAFSLGDMSFKFDRWGWFSFSFGLQMIFNDYTFSNNLTLVRENGMLVPEEIAPTYKKSKINTFGFQIPVLLEINLPQGIFIAGGVYGGVNLDMHTKIKHPKSKMRNIYMNPFYAGVTVRLGYESFYVYGNYGFTEMFSSGRGPKVCPATIGVGLAF